MIPVSKYSSRLGERVRCVVLHTSEGARTVESLGGFLQRTPSQVSYHGAVDDRRYESYVNYSNAAWALRNGNQESDNLCLCAFAGWSRAEWLRHPRMLELTAAQAPQVCDIQPCNPSPAPYPTWHQYGAAMWSASMTADAGYADSAEDRNWSLVWLPDRAHLTSYGHWLLYQSIRAHLVAP